MRTTLSNKPEAFSLQSKKNLKKEDNEDSFFIKKVKYIKTPKNICKSNICFGCINDSPDDPDCCCDAR